ncbi:hypothetical protein LOD99_8297 [Oopsacas minuta]|uniref:3CxxC-type domain-containing protein n=1 Tax=Oopsacas minuta TaxID=111878 RepID=A0AAV7JGN6_9METZ|nr:hypothetical protein LOD99_8297 [Oopsacas minuta]
MASRLSGRSRKKSESAEHELIPIYYRLPGGVEIVSGYLEKRRLKKGTQSKRFFGHYQCENCSSRWTSGYAWQGYQLECKKCHFFEWPTKVFHLENVSDDHEMKTPHLTDLCEKCQKDGVHCLTGHMLNHNVHIIPEFDGTRLKENNKYMIHFGKQLGLDKYDIVIEPQFIQNLFDNLWDSLSRECKSEFKEALKIASIKWKQKNRVDISDKCMDVLRQTTY